MTNIRETFGNIDIYLFDQILKERFEPGASILDAGCGDGRNLVYFLQNDFNVFAIDRNPEAVEYIRALAKTLAPDLPPANFQVAPVEQMPFADASFDAVINNAVLHFAENPQQFSAMITEMWRVLKNGGLFFARLASSIGIEDKIESLGNGRYYLPDDSERFLVDEELLISTTNQLNGIWIEPLKTTNVQNLRCMTTWILRKS